MRDRWHSVRLYRPFATCSQHIEIPSVTRNVLNISGMDYKLGPWGQEGRPDYRGRHEARG